MGKRAREKKWTAQVHAQYQCAYALVASGQRELALVMVHALMQDRIIDRTLYANEDEFNENNIGEFDNQEEHTGEYIDPGKFRELGNQVTQLGNRAGRLYKEVDQALAVWTPPQDPIGWQPDVSRASHAIAGAAAKLNVILRQYRERADSSLDPLVAGLVNSQSFFAEAKSQIEAFLQLFEAPPSRRGGRWERLKIRWNRLMATLRI